MSDRIFLDRPLKTKLTWLVLLTWLDLPGCIPGSEANNRLHETLGSFEP